MPDLDRVTWFFIIFGLVYFLESIGGFYMTSAVVFIEKQFQIPSRLSGTMVSAGDFAYIPVVVFTSYFGGKGNRARWIGGGCILISIANLLISSSNFLFPVEVFQVNGSFIPNSLAYEVSRFVLNSDNDTVWFESTLDAIDPNGTVISGSKNALTIHQEFIKYQSHCFYNPSSPMCINMEERMNERHKVTDIDISAVRVLTALPYAFCHSVVNKLRQEHRRDECSKEHSSVGPFTMIFCGLLILGVGRTMPFSLGLPLIDDNVRKKNMPLMFAGMFIVRILGPIIGLLVGSKLNEIYYTFHPPHGLTPLDPLWIGCWWLGFLIFGLLLFFPSIALTFFPSDTLEEHEEAEEELEMIDLAENGQKLTITITPEKIKKPRKRLNLVDKHIKMTEDGQAVMPESTYDKFIDFTSTMKILLKNPIYVGAMLGRIVDVLAFKGFFVFLGKYLEIQFGVPQFIIQRYLAGTGVVGFGAGVMIGSLTMKKFKLQGRKAAAWVAVCSLMAALLSFANGAVGCESVIGEIGKQAMSTNNTFASCRPDCLCDEAPLYPVCNSKGEVFYSPCHAGCPLSGANFTIYGEVKTDTKQLLTFTNCACAGTSDEIVSRKLCPTAHCDNMFKLFFVNQAICAIFGGMAVVPGMLIILRAVSPEHRSISLGFNGFLVSLLATLPSPVLWGKIFDMSCLMWQNLCDNQTGSCPIYDTSQLRIRIHVIYGSLRLFSLFSDMWVFYWSKGLVLIDEHEEEEEGKEKEPEEKEELPTEVVKLLKEKELIE